MERLSILRDIPPTNYYDINFPKTPVGSVQGSIEVVLALSHFIPNKILGLPTLEIVQLTPCKRLHPLNRFPTLFLILADSVNVGTPWGLCLSEC